MPGNEDGAPAVLQLPTQSLNSLMMTLPRMLRQALQKQHGDPSLRLVHELGDYRVEEMAGDNRLLLTLNTPDGFEVSFAFPADSLVNLGARASDHLERPQRSWLS